MSERYITLAEVNDLLTEENAKRNEELGEDFEEDAFNPVQKSALMHAQTLVNNVHKISAEDAQAIVDEVSQIDCVTDVAAYRIADLLPKYPVEVNAILSKERVNPSPEDIDKIIEIVAKYL